MKWMEFTIKTSSEAAEAITERLAQLGAAGIATEDPNEINFILANDDDTIHVDPSFLDNIPSFTKIQAYFASFEDGLAFHKLEGPGIFSDIDTEHLYAKGSFPKDRISLEEFVLVLQDELAYIGQFFDLGENSVTYQEVDELSWREKFREMYRPMRISKRVFVVPSWEEFSAPRGTKVIHLDPGSAFGTGTHETTQLCVSYIDQYLKPGSKVLDLGTGSGILAIAAAKLGARHVKAIDISEHSVEVAKENIEKNELTSIIDCHVGELHNDKEQYDMIVANLIADILIDLSGEFSSHLTDLGLLVCSGIVKSKREDVLRAFIKEGFELFAGEERNDWYIMVFSK